MVSVHSLHYLTLATGMLKRYFLSNILFVLFANMLIKPLWMFGVDRRVQLLVGHEVYGSYTAVLGLCVVFAIMLDMGVTNYNNLLVAGDKDRIHETLPNMLLVKVVLSLIYFSVLCLLAWVLHYNSETFHLLMLVCGAQILASFVLYLRSNISANHDFKTDALLSIVDKLILIITCSFWLTGFLNPSDFSIQLFVWLQMMAYLITLLLGFLFIRKNYTRISLQALSSEHTKKLFKKSLPYALLIFLMGVYMRGDAVLLERLAGARETGLFANSFRILDMSNTLGVLVAGVLLPMFSRLMMQRERITELVQMSSRLLVPASLAIAIFCGMHAQSIIQLFYHDSTAYSSTIFSILMLSFPAYSIQYIYSTLLTAEQSIRLQIRLAGIGCLLSLLLNVLLIHWFRASGTALAAVVAQWTMACLSMYFSYKHFNWTVSIPLLGRFIAFIAALFLLNGLLFYWQGPLITTVLANIVFVPIIYLSTGFLRLSSVVGYFRKTSELP